MLGISRPVPRIVSVCDIMCIDHLGIFYMVLFYMIVNVGCCNAIPHDVTPVHHLPVKACFHQVCSHMVYKIYILYITCVYYVYFEM